METIRHFYLKSVGTSGTHHEERGLENLSLRGHRDDMMAREKQPVTYITSLCIWTAEQQLERNGKEKKHSLALQSRGSYGET